MLVCDVIGMSEPVRLRDVIREYLDVAFTEDEFPSLSEEHLDKTADDIIEIVDNDMNTRIDEIYDAEYGRVAPPTQP